MQAVKTKMKCSIINAVLCCIASVFTLFVRVKIVFRLKKTILFENYNLTPLDMYNDYPKFIISNLKGRVH